MARPQAVLEEPRMTGDSELRAALQSVVGPLVMAPEMMQELKGGK